MFLNEIILNQRQWLKYDLDLVAECVKVWAGGGALLISVECDTGINYDYLPSPAPHS